eukprot:131114-Pyramimonas_sp.AAC.1
MAERRSLPDVPTLVRRRLEATSARVSRAAPGRGRGGREGQMVNREALAPVQRLARSLVDVANFYA